MVKDYYSLTEEEKQLLRDYKTWNQENPFVFIILFISTVVYVVLLLIGILYSLKSFVGISIFGIMLSQLTIYWFIKRTNKINRIIFGFDNAKKYFFEIGKKDEKMSLKEFITPEQKEE